MDELTTIAQSQPTRLVGSVDLVLGLLATVAGMALSRALAAPAV